MSAAKNHIQADHPTGVREAFKLAALFALIKLLLHLSANLLQPHLGWGYFTDELYYILCGQRLDWGYVDHGPIVALQARLAVVLFGTCRCVEAFADWFAGMADGCSTRWAGDCTSLGLALSAIPGYRQLPNHEQF